MSSAFQFHCSTPPWNVGQIAVLRHLDGALDGFLAANVVERPCAGHLADSTDDDVEERDGHSAVFSCAMNGPGAPRGFFTVSISIPQIGANGKR